MNRRQALFAAASVLGTACLPRLSASAAFLPQEDVPRRGSLTPPASGLINVAFLIGNNANVIDTAGSWEVFQDAVVYGRDEPRPFRMFTVSESTQPVRMTGGLRVVPEYALADAPQPRVLVVPSTDVTPAVLEWVRKTSAATDVTMSVCTGAFHLANAGLLDGLAATTHHNFLDDFERKFPKVNVIRGRRFVEGSDRIATAGGLASGIDLALRVVERYFGKEVAQETARYMEYEGQGWQT